MPPVLFRGRVVEKRVCIFVDGENFRYSIQDLFRGIPTLDEYLPREAKWTDFFDWLVEQTSDFAERLRTYWYVVQHIDYRPYRIGSSRLGVDELKRVLSKNASFKQELEGLEADGLADKIKAIVRYSNKQRRFNKKKVRWMDCSSRWHCYKAQFYRV